MHVVPFTWVFRLKKLNTEDTKFLEKARCCVRGDFQAPEVDFDPTAIYAPVASHESIRLILAISAAEDLIVEGGDVDNAYLYGSLDVPIYMEQPSDSSGIVENPELVCKLLKSMYGLRQAGHIWGSLLVRTLKEWGFTESSIDDRVLIKSLRTEFIILTIVVDDLLMASNSRAMLENFKAKIASKFNVKLFGASFLGWEIQRSKEGIFISQHRYCQDILSRYGMSRYNGTKTPMSSTEDLRAAAENETELSKKAHSIFRKQVGELLYLARCTRTDISFSVSALTRSLHTPTARHTGMINRLLRYISSTPTLGIMYRAYPRERGLSCFSDADWAGCQETRHSTTGIVVNMHGSAVFWKSKRQTVVALSSAEAEYVALYTAARELTWIR